ncbi:MAG: polysaccharide deacetylase family protein [Sedimentisphaerales bacterium]|nr:polysaccharide deacetylase family protein [Sedimentisphaerales bacterium]
MVDNGWKPIGAFLLAGIVLLASGAARAQAAPDGADDTIRLIIRADDIGSCHTANVACIQTYREGIVQSVEIMMPAPWCNEAIKMLRENPGLDVGVHLTLTSEWDHYKWGPLTEAPSLVDAQGHFYPTTSQRADFPPHTGFLQADPNLAEVEKELRAQIELARARIPQVSHLSAHMGTPTGTPALRRLVAGLAEEYGLPIETPGVRPVRGFYDRRSRGLDHEAALLAALEELGPGTWLFLEHPGLDTAEMRAIGHRGYEDVAADRAGVTRAFTSDKVKRLIARRGIRLISYAEWLRESKRPGSPADHTGP